MLTTIYIILDVDKQIEDLIESAYLNSQEMILIGDINLDFFDQTAYCKHLTSSQDIKEVKYVSTYQRIVTRPKSKTCLDHVYSTHGHFIFDTFVPNIGLSDHLPISICRKYFNQNKFLHTKL